MSYVIKDHQESMYATITGNTVERYSFDAWGRRRNPQTLSYDNVTTSFDRGYTLHEHYDDFGLINMNGRLYDPLVGRMISPDIVIQDEQNSQAYNRYSYCFNNPLRFTDPSGYISVGGSRNYWRQLLYLDSWNTHSNTHSSFSTDESLGNQIPVDDWFENEETGEIYYNANMHKGDEGTGAMKGSGWKWLGANGMFTDGDMGAEISLIAQNHGRIEINRGDISLMLDPNSAKSFMAAQGYKQVPKQAIEYSYSYTESYTSTPGHNFHITYGENYRYWEKVAYVPKGSDVISTTPIGQALYGKPHSDPFYIPQVTRNIYSYEQTTKLRLLGKVIKTLNGYHDYVNSYDCGSIDNYINNGGGNPLIDLYIKKYPK